MLIQLSHFPPFTPLHPAHPLPPTFPPYSSCPWVILISSLASTFPTLFLPYPCLFSTYHLCYLFSVPFPPLPLPPALLSLFSSCPWVEYISSLASPFPILFLTSPCLFSTYHLCYLFSVLFPPLSPSHSPADNPPCDLHFCDFFQF